MARSAIRVAKPTCARSFCAVISAKSPSSASAPPIDWTVFAVDTATSPDSSLPACRVELALAGPSFCACACVCVCVACACAYASPRARSARAAVAARRALAPPIQRPRRARPRAPPRTAAAAHAASPLPPRRWQTPTCVAHLRRPEAGGRTAMASARESPAAQVRARDNTHMEKGGIGQRWCSWNGVCAA
eukprot:3376288-Pleurochrysis_carterae.AAC.1